MQRYYAAKNSYDDAALPFAQSPKDGTKRYDISVEADGQTYTPDGGARGPPTPSAAA